MAFILHYAIIISQYLWFDGYICLTDREIISAGRSWSYVARDHSKSVISPLIPDAIITREYFLNICLPLGVEFDKILHTGLTIPPFPTD